MKQFLFRLVDHWLICHIDNMYIGETYDISFDIRDSLDDYESIDDKELIKFLIININDIRLMNGRCVEIISYNEDEDGVYLDIGEMWDYMNEGWKGWKKGKGNRVLRCYFK